MVCKASDSCLEMMRSVLGPGPSDEQLVRALHLAKNDVNLAFNVLFDTIGYKGNTVMVKRTSAGSGTRVSTSDSKESTPCIEVPEQMPALSIPGEKHLHTNVLVSSTKKCSEDEELSDNNTKLADNVIYKRREKSRIKYDNVDDDVDSNENKLDMQRNIDAVLEDGYQKGNVICSRRWLFLGESEVSGYSTSRGGRLKSGTVLSLTFPKPIDYSSRSRGWGRGKNSSAVQQIVRFGTRESGDIGRLPGDWAKCLIPLTSNGNVRAVGICRAAPEVLTTMDTVVLTLRLYVSTDFFSKHNDHSSSLASTTSGSTNHPLPDLFRLLGKEPFKKAEFTPEDLYSRKRCLNSKEMSLPVEKRRKLISKEIEENDKPDESLCDSDVTHLVGTSDSSNLEEMEPPSELSCELRSYQKQALNWMSKMESGLSSEEASQTLHPCWNAFRLDDEEGTVVYLNVFSGEATMDFPSALKLAKGGILADAMGLGKTVMTIALILSNPARGGGSENVMVEKVQEKNVQTRSSRRCASSSKKGGGTLIVCPMTLLGQWKTEIETHCKDGKLSVYTHYTTGRTRDANVLLNYDVVLTTYGVLTSEYQNGDGALHSVNWFRIVLDEAHTIKASKCQSAQASFSLSADTRWCLTGTPIQNKLEDAFSLLHFLRVEPWCNWSWWYKLVQKPFEDGDERGLILLKTILKPLMLRRTKDTTDKFGRPILVLPPSTSEIVECDFSEAERDFYDALYKKSKTKFDQFVEQGKVLHNYASILELLLRMRQCCDHPFLVLSRGDTSQFSDLDKLAKRFLEGSSYNGQSKAYVEGVVDDLRKGNKAECPICLEVAEDAVLTPCAHCMCRECLFSSWTSISSGACPICRKMMTRLDILTAPTENRFRVDVEKNWTESSKIQALMKELEAIRSTKAKSIVFSQWTAFLDLLQIPLNRHKFKYVRLDGTLNQPQREKVIKDFSNDPTILVMLISLKAGGVGINLTAASNVFLLDPWWNPAVEEQAIMRIHRIGQTKNVSIKRFITKETVEERMLQVQARKQRMISGALTDEEIRSARIEELKMLFR